MERKESQPSAKKRAKEHLQQLTFDGIEDLPNPEIILDRCIVVSPPTYVKQGKAHLWDCTVHTVPVWFDLEQNTEYKLHATTYASKANKAAVKPGDMIAVSGIPYTQELTLQDGTTQVLHHLTVSKLTMIESAPEPKAQPITIFEIKPEQQ